MKLAYVPIVRPMFRGAALGLDAQTARALEALAAGLGADLKVFAPVEDAAQAQAAAQALASGPPDLLVLQHVTFATGDLVVPLLELDLPTVAWALPEAFESGRLPQNALCGLNMTVSLPARRTRPLRWVYGAPDDPAALGTVKRALNGAATAARLRGARLLQLGGSAPGFYRIENEPEGALIDHESLSPFIEAARSGEAAPATDEPRAPGLGDLAGALRIERALDDAARGYDAVSLRCWPEVPEELGSVACLACARLADRGVPVACEGDTLGALSMLAAGWVSGQSAALLDLTHTAQGALMFWHCGNVARVWAEETRLEAHFNRQVPAVRAMTLRPGPVTGLRLLEDRRALIFRAEVTRREGAYDGVSGWVTDFRVNGEPLGAFDFLGLILEERLPHHLAFALGDCEAELRETCLWLGYEPLVPRAPTGVIRWS